MSMSIEKGMSSCFACNHPIASVITSVIICLVVGNNLPAISFDISSDSIAIDTLQDKSLFVSDQLLSSEQYWWSAW